MNLDIDALLAGFGEDEPSGPDMEYEAEFAELTIAATPKAEQQVGDQVKEAEDADFPEVLKVGEAILAQSMDLRVAVTMAEAALARAGFPGFAQIMQYIDGALSQHWATVHPQLDADDDDDPTERLNALRGLTDTATTLRQLRRAPLTDSKMMGRFGLRHIAVARGEMAPPADMENPPDMAAVGAAFKDTSEESMSDIREGLAASLAAAEAVVATLDEHVPGQGPDLDPMISMLRQAQTEIAEHLGGAAPTVVESEGGDAAPATSGGSSASAAAAGGGVGAISNPNDVTRALDLIMEYYARSEPSSPVPLLLARARRLVSADFMTIMKDMATSGLDEVRTLGGLPEDEEEEY